MSDRHFAGKITAIVPAAGVGKRMQADRPKQYLEILGKTVLEHTLSRLLSHPDIEHVVVAISDGDPYFEQLPIATHPKVIRVSGGSERADSVLRGLEYVSQHQMSPWVLVHDAARPCVKLADISHLIERCLAEQIGGILAMPVRDTMKRAAHHNAVSNTVDHTVDREGLWHALTPQMYPTHTLTQALSKALQSQAVITDEASAIEWSGGASLLVPGSGDNIKITQPEDLALAEFYLQREQTLCLE